MDCEKAKELFTCYHDGDLDHKTHSFVEKHIKECKECLEEWEGFKITVNEISGLLPMVAPENLVQSVETKIRKRSKGRFFGKQSSNATQFALISFILILMFMLVYFMLSVVNEINIIKNEDNTDASVLNSSLNSLSSENEIK